MNSASATGIVLLVSDWVITSARRNSFPSDGHLSLDDQGPFGWDFLDHFPSDDDEGNECTGGRRGSHGCAAAPHSQSRRARLLFSIEALPRYTGMRISSLSGQTTGPGFVPTPYFFIDVAPTPTPTGRTCAAFPRRKILPVPQSPHDGGTYTDCSLIRCFALLPWTYPRHLIGQTRGAIQRAPLRPRPAGARTICWRKGGVESA
jgi:hypothetical protein